MAVMIDPPGYFLWDFAGVDGLQAALNLFGEKVGHLAPFQSLETSFNAHACSVLRLAERNFRVALSRDHGLDLAIADMGLNLWVKLSNPLKASAPIRQAASGCERIATLVISEQWGQTCLPRLGTTQPIHRLENLPLHCAVPARIEQKSVLVWHHSWLGHPRFDLHTAQANAQTIAQAITVEIQSHHYPTDAGRGTTAAATRGHHPTL
ncbi:MAG TPA: hypothetical protein V6D06_03285 [Trichocoleus sp.]